MPDFTFTQLRWRVHASKMYPGRWRVYSAYGGVSNKDGKRFETWGEAMLYANCQADRLRKCSMCKHPMHRGQRCNFPITEEIRDDVYVFTTPTYETRVMLIDTCSCGMQ